MNLSDFALDFLLKKKVDKVFLITGGAISFLVDSFSNNKKIKYISVAHEQSAAMMADSYSRVGPNFSCTMATSGPGATNLLTGIACSYFDSIPSLHICGQVNTYEQQDFHHSTKNVRQVGFQETDIVNMSKPITKFSYKLKNEKEIKYILEKAYHLATSGRPGPVLIDIPMDLQKKIINPKKLRSFTYPLKKKINLKSKIKDLKRLFFNSKKPVIILGGGLKYSRSENLINKLLKKLKIPIVTTWSGCDLVDYNNSYYVGNIGVYGSRSANFTVQNSDLIFCLGSRLDTRVTGGVPKNFARNAYKIVVDIDEHELNKQRGLNIDLKINHDLKDFLNNLIKSNFKITCDKMWHKKTINFKKKYPIVLKNYYSQKNFVNPYVFIDKLSKILKKNDIIIADTGAHLTWTMQSFKVIKGQKLFSAFGNSPMGYALPASIGASIVKRKKKIICIDGDGSLQINLQELHTVDKLKLPIKIFIFNDKGYAIIKQFQEMYLGKRLEASKKGVSNPNFQKIAQAFNINYNLIRSHKDLSKIKKLIDSNKSEFVEIKIKQNQKIIPKLQFGNPLEDMSPLLTRKEFRENMEVPIIDKNKKI